MLNRVRLWEYKDIQKSHHSKVVHSIKEIILDHETVMCLDFISFIPYSSYVFDIMLAFIKGQIKNNHIDTISACFINYKSTVYNVQCSVT